MSDNWDEEYEGDDDYEDEEDENDGTAWYECPLCGEEVYEDANICPACDQYMTPVIMTRSGSKPMWYVVLSLAGILAVVVILSGILGLIPFL